MMVLSGGEQRQEHQHQHQRVQHQVLHLRLRHQVLLRPAYQLPLHPVRHQLLVQVLQLLVQVVQVLVQVVQVRLHLVQAVQPVRHQVPVRQRQQRSRIKRGRGGYTLQSPTCIEV